MERLLHLLTLYRRMARRKWTSIIGKKRISDARGVSGADGREREKKAV